METTQNNKNNFHSFCAKYGAITGGALIILQLLFYVISGKMNSGENYAGTANTVIFVISLFYFSRQYRNEYSSAYFTYGSAFKTSFMLGLYAAIIVSFFYYVFYKFNPEAVNILLLEFQQIYAESGMPEDQIEAMLGVLQRMWSPGIIAFSSFLGLIIQTVIISLITALLNTKKDTDQGSSPFDRDMSKIQD